MVRVALFGGGSRLARIVSWKIARADHHAIRIARAATDVARPGAVADMLAKFRPDVAVNCAAWTNVAGCECDESLSERDNRNTAWRFAVACERAGVPAIHLSTDYATTDLVYGRHKRAGEVWALEHGACVMRLAILHRDEAFRYQWLNGVTVSNRIFSDEAARRIASLILADVGRRYRGRLVALQAPPVTVAEMILGEDPTDSREVVSDPDEVSRRVGYAMPLDTTWTDDVEVLP